MLNAPVCCLQLHWPLQHCKQPLCAPVVNNRLFVTAAPFYLITALIPEEAYCCFGSNNIPCIPPTLLLLLLTTTLSPIALLLLFLQTPSALLSASLTPPQHYSLGLFLTATLTHSALDQLALFILFLQTSLPVNSIVFLSPLSRLFFLY